MDNAIYEELLKDAKYALNSKSRDIVYEAYGQAKIARRLEAISREQFMELNDMLVKNGLNDPKAGLE